MRGLMFIFLMFCHLTCWANSECVVMVHGMTRTSASMETLANSLRSEGYYVVNETYPTNLYNIQKVASTYIPYYLKKCEENQHAEKIHFVTHSIGGLVVRQYLQNNQLPQGSRIVMLAPPNHGSTLADRFRDWKIFRYVTGPMGQQLQTGKNAFSEQLPEYFPNDIGIITGNSSLNPIAAVLLGGENDGKVSVPSAKLAGMKDFTVVRSSHTFIAKSDKVIKLTSGFLKNGIFPKIYPSPAKVRYF